MEQLQFQQPLESKSLNLSKKKTRVKNFDKLNLCLQIINRELV